MRLQLSDGPAQGAVIYNSVTGEPVQLLASKATRKAKKEAKKEVKMARIDNKKARKVNRQTSKTQRQTTKQVKKQTRRDVGVERQNKNMLKVKGREEVNRTRQQAKIDKHQSKSDKINSGSDSSDNTDSNIDPNQNAMPNDVYNDVPGGDYMTPDTDESYYPESDTVDTDYQEVTYDQPMEDGIWGTLIKGAGQIIQKVSSSQAGQAVQNVATAQQQINQLRVVNSDLKNQVAAAKNKSLLYAGAGFLGGAVTGYVIAKSIKK